MIRLQFVKRTDPRYQEIRDRHYIPNMGTHGQQAHYLIFDEDNLAGIISGASAVHSCAPRDRFFGLSKDRRIKEAQINAIVNNVVFRLERTRPNLATQVLALWRRRIAADWEYLYGVPVAGFETFVIEEVRDYETDRCGTLYRADNWSEVGFTKGNTKAHHKNAKGGGMNTSHSRRDVEPKLIFCRRVKKAQLPTYYASSWKSPELSKERSRKRAELLEGQRNLDL